MQVFDGLKNAHRLRKRIKEDSIKKKVNKNLLREYSNHPNRLMMASCLQRKYVDLIFHAYSKHWVNWNCLMDNRVGAYGSIDPETGDFRVEGNIYDPTFQRELDKHGVEVNVSDFPPQEGQIEEDFVVVSQGVKCGDFYTCDRCHQTHSHGRIDGQWIFTFKHGKRGGVLVMHRPQRISLPSVVLESLYKINKLRHKWLVTSTHTCPAYSMYLSDKSGEKVTLTYVPKCPIAGVTTDTNGGSAWHIDAQTGLFRKACGTSGGHHSYIPLFEVKHPISHIEQAFPSDLWQISFPPWEPLDEDGEEDPIDVSMEDSDSDVFG